MRRLAMLLLLTACVSDDSTTADAFIYTSPDAKKKPDAAVPDAPEAVADAKVATPDAPLPEPDAMVGEPDAMLPMGPAEVILNELSPNFVNRHDLVELLVTKSGTTDGIKIEKDYPHNTGVLAVLPDVIVYEGQLIVVHLVPAGTTAAAETLAIDEAKSADNFDGAWDFLGEADDIGYQNRVISIRNADGDVTSAVPFFRHDLTDPDQKPVDFPADVQEIIDASLWNEICDPAPCTYESNLADVTVDWLGSGTDTNADAPTGASVARKPGAAANKVADWTPPPAAAPYNSYGEANP